VLETMRLTVSDAFPMMMVRIAREKALPFEPLVPNPEAIAAMREARKGKLPRFKDVDALMKDLKPYLGLFLVATICPEKNTLRTTGNWMPCGSLSTTLCD